LDIMYIDKKEPETAYPEEDSILRSEKPEK
jgi:hypothetical protein